MWALTSVAAPQGDEDLPDVRSIIRRAEAFAPTEAATSDGGQRPAPAAFEPRAGGLSWRHWAAAGAVAASFMAIGIGIGVGYSGGSALQAPLAAASEIVTGAGELTTMSLGDGSSIRLGPNSRLRLMVDDEQRIAWLEGRAFFGVQADSARPFVVRTAQGQAQALGTRFEVRDEDEFRVLVVDGSVAVTASGAEVRLSEGEMTRSVNGGLPSSERVEDVFAHLSWLGNAIVFQATPLARALREIEARYGVPIRLQEAELSDVTVTATFTDRSLDEVTFVLCEIVNAACSIQNDTILVGEGGPGAPRPAHDEP